MPTKSQVLRPPAVTQASAILRGRRWLPGRESALPPAVQTSLSVEQMKKAIKKAKTGELEATMLSQIAAARLLPCSPQYVFHPTRKWRFDFAWPDIRFALEVNGAIYVGGAHSRGKGQENDMEKIAEAAILGWTTICVSSNQIKSGEALRWVEAIVQQRRAGL